MLGAAYQDHGLIYIQDLGHPLLMNNLGPREFSRLMTDAKVTRITFHGLRNGSGISG